MKIEYAVNTYDRQLHRRTPYSQIFEVCCWTPDFGEGYWQLDWNGVWDDAMVPVPDTYVLLKGVL